MSAPYLVLSPATFGATLDSQVQNHPLVDVRAYPVCSVTFLAVLSS